MLGDTTRSEYFILELFEHIFEHINCPLLGLILIPINVDPRISRGAFSIPLFRAGHTKQCSFLLKLSRLETFLVIATYNCVFCEKNLGLKSVP